MVAGLVLPAPLGDDHRERRPSATVFATGELHRGPRGPLRLRGPAGIEERFAQPPGRGEGLRLLAEGVLPQRDWIVPDRLPSDAPHGEEGDCGHGGHHRATAACRPFRPPRPVEEAGDDDRHPHHGQIEIAVGSRLEDRPEIGHGEDREDDHRSGQDDPPVVPGPPGQARGQQREHEDRAGEGEVIERRELVVGALVEGPEDELHIEGEDPRLKSQGRQE